MRNQNFIQLLATNLIKNGNKKLTYSDITIIGIDHQETKYTFNVKFDKKKYQLILQPHKHNEKSNSASFINLRDNGRPNGRKSVIQLTIDKSNFIIAKNSFKLIQNRNITIVQNRMGLKKIQKLLC